MAKKVTEGAMAPSSEQTTYVSWPKEGVTISGDAAAMALGKRARITLEGIVRGYSMRDTGCSADLKVKTVKIEALGGGKGEDEDETRSMTDVARDLKKGEKRAYKKG